MTRISLRLPSWAGVLSKITPNSPGILNCVMNPRLFLSLALTIFLLLVLISLWTHFSSIGHYRYVSINSVGTDAQEDLSTHNYGIVIDAGSSSSKVHIFHWPPHNGDPHKLLTIYSLTDELGDPLTKKVEPGVSSFASSPKAAFNSLVPLLAFASDNIPPDKYSQTIIYVLGTAGLRLLPKADQDRIVSHLYLVLPLEFPFHLPKDGVQVIPGKLEGVFSWITINYLLNRFSPESHAHRGKVLSATHESYTDQDPNHDVEEERIHTVGAIDMGGASLQIAFEIPQQVDVTGLTDNLVEINLGCGIRDNQHKHRVYTNTYLGYGTNEARSKYYKMMVEQHIADSTHNHSSSDGQDHPSLKDPCTQLDLVENITIDKEYSLRVRGLGDFTACKRAISPLLKPDIQANKTGSREEEGGLSQFPPPVLDHPCVHNGEGCEKKVTGFKRPPASLLYTSMDFYGTSEFWYTMRDVLRMGGAYSAEEFEKKSKEFCKTEWRLVRERFTKKLYTYADHYRLRSQCLKSSWLSVILHEGLEFSYNSISLRTASSIGGQSVQWPLGALLYYTRYLPLREVQLQQLKYTQPSKWDHNWLTHSSFTLPLLVVLAVILLLIFCRHGRRQSLQLSSGSNSRLPKSYSHASVLKIQRRNSTVTLANPQGNILPRNQSSVKLAGLV